MKRTAFLLMLLCGVSFGQDTNHMKPAGKNSDGQPVHSVDFLDTLAGGGLTGNGLIHTLPIWTSAINLDHLGAATNGQIPIGSTGADPVIAAITAGTGISVTNGAGSITLANTLAGVTGGATNRVNLWTGATTMSYNDYIRSATSTNPLTGLVLGNGTDGTTQPTGPGATATGARLNIVEDYSSGATKTQLNVDIGGIAGPASVIGFRADGTPAARTALVADDLIFSYHSAGWQASTTSYQQGPVMDFFASGAAAANAQPGYIVISPVGSTNYTRLDKHVRMPDIAGVATGKVLYVVDGATGDIGAETLAVTPTLADIGTNSTDDTKRTFTITPGGVLLFSGTGDSGISVDDSTGITVVGGNSAAALGVGSVYFYVTSTSLRAFQTSWQDFSAIDYAKGLFTSVTGLIGVQTIVNGDQSVVPIAVRPGTVVTAVRIKYAGTDASTGFKITVRKRDETTNATTYTTVGAQQTLHSASVVTTSYNLGGNLTIVEGFSYDILLEGDIPAAQTASFYAYGVQTGVRGL